MRVKLGVIWIAVAAAGVFGVGAGLAAAPSSLPQKPRVAVLDFESHTYSYGDHIEEMARDAVSAALVNRGHLAPYTRKDLEKVLGEAWLTLSGIVDSTTAVTIGKKTGVQIVVCGAVHSASGETKSSTDRKGNTTYTTSAEVTLHCKAIDAQDGSIWKEDSYTGSASHWGEMEWDKLIPEALQDAAEEFAKELVPPITGVVVKVEPEAEGGYFIVNLGAKHGVTSKSEFKVERKGEEIRDLDGKVIGALQEFICLAHPIKDGIQEGMTKLAPGYYKKDLFGKSWREERKWVSKVQVGDRVTAKVREDDK